MMINNYKNVHLPRSSSSVIVVNLLPAFPSPQSAACSRVVYGIPQLRVFKMAYNSEAMAECSGFLRSLYVTVDQLIEKVVRMEAVYRARLVFVCVSFSSTSSICNKLALFDAYKKQTQVIPTTFLTKHSCFIYPCFHLIVLLN